MADISKPAGAAVSQQAYVLTTEGSGSSTIQAQYMSVSILGKGTSGTFTVQVGDNAAQTLSAGTTYTLPYIGKPYTQAVVASGGGSVTLEITVIY